MKLLLILIVIFCLSVVSTLKINPYLDSSRIPSGTPLTSGAGYVYPQLNPFNGQDGLVLK